MKNHLVKHFCISYNLITFERQERHRPVVQYLIGNFNAIFMKKKVVPLCIFFVCLMSFSSQSQNIEEILKSHAKVMGYEKLAEKKLGP